MDPYRETVEPQASRFFLDYEARVFIDLHEVTEMSQINDPDGKWEIWYRNRPKISIFYDELGESIFTALLKYRAMEVPEGVKSDPDKDGYGDDE